MDNTVNCKHFSTCWQDTSGPWVDDLYR